MIPIRSIAPRASLLLALAGCSSVGVGISMPVLPGVSIEVGTGTVLHDPSRPLSAPSR